MWSEIHYILGRAFDLWLWPFQDLPPTWQVCALALPVAIFALLVFRYSSNQRAIERTKARIMSHLVELRLSRDDAKVMMRARREILRHSLTYMRHMLLPMAVMIVPLVLVMVQVESRYAFRPLAPDESAIVTATLDGDYRPVSELKVELLLPVGLEQETSALRIDETGEILWRVGALTPGEHRIEIRVGDSGVAGRVVVGGAGARPVPAFYRADDWRTLLYPGLPPLENASMVSAITVSYPRERAVFAGLSSASWILLGVSLFFAYALRGIFGVTF